MTAGSPTAIMPAPGIQRDGTSLSSAAWIDGRWSRFVNGKPRKMQGVTAISDDVDGVPRGMGVHSESGKRHLHIGTANSISTITFDSENVTTAPVPRDLPFTPEADSLWQFDIRNHPVIAGNPAYLIAHPGRNLLNIDSQENTPVIWGKAADASSMSVMANAPQVSGGVVVLHPFVFVYGNSGYIANSEANQPENWTSGFAKIGRAHV